MSVQTVLTFSGLCRCAKSADNQTYRAPYLGVLTEQVTHRPSPVVKTVLLLLLLLANPRTVAYHFLI